MEKDPDNNENMWDLWFDELDEPTQELKCECGIWITYGKQYQPERHPTYCPVYQDWKRYEKYR